MALVGYISADGKFKPSYEAQHAAVLRAKVNPGRIWVDGREPFERFLSSLRIDDNDEVVLHSLVVFAKGGARLRRGSMTGRLQQILDLGIHVRETETGRSTANPAEQAAMIADAVEWCANGRKPRENRTPGRPREARCTTEQREKIRKIWTKKGKATKAERIDAIRLIPGLEWFNRSAGYVLAERHGWNVGERQDG